MTTIIEKVRKNPKFGVVTRSETENLPMRTLVRLTNVKRGGFPRLPVVPAGQKMKFPQKETDGKKILVSTIAYSIQKENHFGFRHALK